MIFTKSVYIQYVYAESCSDDWQVGRNGLGWLGVGAGSLNTGWSQSFFFFFLRLRFK